MSAYFHYTLKKNTGTTLVELMLAMALSMLLVGILLEIYTASQRAYHLYTALNQIQGNAKAAIAILKSDIRKAGYIGCPKLSADFIVHPFFSYSIAADNKLTGSDTGITVRYANFTGVELQQRMHDDVTLHASNHTHFSVGDVLMISDCKQAEVFQVKEIILSKDSQIIFPLYPLQNKYELHAEIGRLNINTYFVAKTERKYSDGSAIYSLFVRDIHQRKTELVEGIHDMQVTYAMSQNQSWSRLMGVAIKLNVAAPPLKKNWYMFVSLNTE